MREGALLKVDEPLLFFGQALDLIRLIQNPTELTPNSTDFI
jgi:hypothetical protein